MRLTYIFALILATASPAVAQTSLSVVSGVDSIGRSTTQWLEILQGRLDAEQYSMTRDIERRMTTAEHAWEKLIRGRAGDWERMTHAIAELYQPAPPPKHASIVLGNRGASDAFVHDAGTIGFDLSALHAEYGSATESANADRIDRLFRHEYAHLMQKSWLAAHPYSPRSPLEHALLDIWLEGLGTWHSLSEPWRATAEGHSARARESLALMEPRLLVRLAALACSGSTEMAVLTADLSRGPFGQKWGALTAGLWLEREAALSRTRTEALQSFIQAGPEGVWELAGRQLGPELRALLGEIRQVETICAGEAGRRAS